MSAILSRPQCVNTTTTTALTTTITATTATLTTSATTTSAIAATYTATDAVTDAAFDMFAYSTVNWFPRYPDTQNTYVIIIAQQTCGCQW